MPKIFSTITHTLFAVLFSVNTAYAATSPDNVRLFGGTGPASTPKDVAGFACIVVKLALNLVPFLVVIAVASFIFGLIKYLGHGDNEEKRTEGVKMMVYGTLVFFFMVSVWGILRITGAGLGIELMIPQFKSGGPNPIGACK